MALLPASLTMGQAPVTQARRDDAMGREHWPLPPPADGRVRGCRASTVPILKMNHWRSFTSYVIENQQRTWEEPTGETTPEGDYFSPSCP
jgi:hypothetical protein